MGGTLPTGLYRVAVDPGRLLDGLDADQVAAVTSPGAPLAIVAPAGSGKTRVLTRRLAYRVAEGSADAAHTLAITFTRKAAGELLRRVDELGGRPRPTVGTFHGVAWSVLRRRWADQNVRRLPELLPQPERLLADLSELSARGPRPLTPPEAAAEIGWAHARLVPPDQYEAAAARASRRPGAGTPAVAEAYRAYEKAKRARRLVDFDDLLALVTREISRDGTFAEVQRWRFRHLYVDEFQDVNALQRALLEAWRGGRPDLCVVGDPNQAIYEWNGADPGWIADFAVHHPGATIVRLNRNYRSSPEIVAAATRVLGRGPEVDAVQPAGPPPAIHRFDNEVGEAAGVAGLLHADRVPGRRWSSFGVLVRTHAQVPLLERALRDAGIPARTRGGTPLLAQPAVRAALDAAMSGPEPSRLRDFLDELDDEVAAGATSPVLATMAALGRQFVAVDPSAGIASFRAWLAVGSPGDDGADGADAVDIVTFHAAKGLEWPVVVVAGLERGLVPHASATTVAARDEEARLLHVALTRAEHRLHLTWAARRGGSARVRSPLIAAVDAVIAEPVAPPPRRLVRAAPAVDPALAALQAWRRTAAVAVGLPEPSICSDEALAAVATARPATVAELAALPEIGPIAARRLGPRLLAALDRASSSPSSPK
jgi:DNA helicase II / ATP-dependent DNA helicase PcrA